VRHSELEATRRLQAFLIDHFTVDELTRLIRTHIARDAHTWLPGTTIDRETFVYLAFHAMDRRRLIDDTFFAALASLRPKRMKELGAIEEAYRSSGSREANNGTIEALHARNAEGRSTTLEEGPDTGNALRAALQESQQQALARAWSAQTVPERIALGLLAAMLAFVSALAVVAPRERPPEPVSWFPEEVRVAYDRCDGSSIGDFTFNTEFWGASHGFGEHETVVLAIGNGKLLGGEQSTPMSLAGHKGPIVGTAWRANSQLLTVSEDGVARVWNLDGSEPAVLRGHEGAIMHGAWGLHGRLLTVSTDGTARVWYETTVEPVVLRGHEGPVWHGAFGPDGEILTVGNDGTARVWPFDGSEPVILRGHEGPIWHGAIGPSGRVLTVSSDGTARVWVPGGSQEATSLRGHEGPVTHGAWGPDGRILTVSEDGTARIWSHDGSVRVLQHEAAVTQGTWGPAGQVLTVTRGGTVRLWSRDGLANATFTPPEGTRRAEFFEHGIVTISKNSVSTWDFSGNELSTRQFVGGTLDSLSVGPMGRIAISRTANAEQSGRVFRILNSAGWTLGSKEPPWMLGGVGTGDEAKLLELTAVDRQAVFSFGGREFAVPRDRCVHVVLQCRGTAASEKWTSRGQRCASMLPAP
jgi:WD40 repeat protein